MNQKIVPLCSRCIALAKDGWKVTEGGRRQKITCAICGKRRL